MTRTCADATERPKAVAHSRRWRVGFGALLTLVGAAGMSVQYVLSALAPFIVEELRLTRAGLGLLPSVTFGVAALTSLVAGPVLDRLGGRTFMLATFGLSSLALLFVAHAPTYAWLVAAAVIGGTAVAASNPVTSNVVAAYVRSRPGIYLGMKQGGAQLYAFATGAALPTVALSVGWRAGAWLSCLPSAAGAFIALRLLPARRDPRDAQTAEASMRLLGLTWLGAYALLMGAGQGVIVAYLPLYSFEALGFTPVAAGFVGALTGLSGVFGRIGWGYAGNDIASTTLLGSLAASAVFCVALIAAAVHVGAWALWVGAIGFGTTSGAWATGAMLAVVRVTGPREAGHVSGHVMLAAYVGVLASAVTFGAVVDATASYGLAWTLVLTVFVVALLVVLLQIQRRHALPRLGRPD